MPRMVSSAVCGSLRCPAAGLHIGSQALPHKDWRQRLVSLIERYPKVQTSAMGFPPDWRTRPFWQ